MRTPLFVLALSLLLSAGCGSAASNAASTGSAGATPGALTGPEQAYLARVVAAVPGAPGKWSKATLAGYGYAACTSLNSDADNPEAAVAAVTASGVDDAAARAIVRAAADDLCPAASADGLSPSASPTSATQQANEVGKTVVNGGIAITVKGARTVDSIQLNESNFRPGSGYEKYTKTPAGAGAKYVVVETHVANNAKTSIDLTCSLPVKTALIDAQQRNFDPIDDLYKLKGNPECNDQLQPGFESDMTWAYRVPATASVLGWVFQDITDLSAPRQDWTTVRLQV